MVSSLHSQIVRKILTQSLGLKKGEAVTVETWNSGLAFAKEVVRQARRMGCVPLLIFEDEPTYLDGVKHTPKDVLGLMGKHEYGLLASTDAYVFIPGPPLGVYYKRMTREEFSNATKYNSSWYDAAEKAKLKGVRLTFGYVGSDMARFLGKPVPEVVHAQLEAALADFGKISAKGKALAKYIKRGASVSLRSGGMELKFKLSGELEVEDGIVDKRDVSSGQNMTYIPPGFVLNEVDKNSASGKVKLSPSLTRFGVAGGAVLEFKRGKLVRWSSSESGDILDKLLRNFPEKNRVLSTFTVGLNDKLGYGFGQDRLVAGAVGLGGFGFTGILQKANATIDGTQIVTAGGLK
jgi:leucyl aminopeptidase (aminopeptidase T)